MPGIGQIASRLHQLAMSCCALVFALFGAAGSTQGPAQSTLLRSAVTQSESGGADPLHRGRARPSSTVSRVGRAVAHAWIPLGAMTLPPDRLDRPEVRDRDGFDLDLPFATELRSAKTGWSPARPRGPPLAA